MIYQSLINIDHVIFKAINGLAFKWFWLDMAGVFFANYFPYVVGAAIFLFLFKYRKTWQMVLTALAAAVIARFGVVEIIRWFKPRVRPFNAADINLLVGKVNESSFPSGHATFFFALATVVFLNNKKLGLWFYGAALIISIARIFVGVHWPLDVLAGAVVGILVGWAADNISKKYIFKNNL